MRVISLLASGTEIVCGLGAGESLVGRSHECDNPSWVKSLPACTTPAFDIDLASGQIDAEVRRRLKAREPLYHVHTDLINGLKPDLLITQAHCEVCAVTPGDISHAGCAVAGQVMALEAGSIHGIHDGVLAIGAALHRQSAAMDLVASMERQIDAVWNAVKHRPPPGIVVLEWTDPIFALGNWGPELVEAANGQTLIGEKARHSRPIPWQQVRDADPEHLIIAPCGFDLDRALREVPLLETLPGWFDLRAVREEKVALADGNKYFNRSGTTIIQTVEILAEILHGYPAGHRDKAWRQYRSSQAAPRIRELHAQARAKGLPSYTDPTTGYQVFTADFLKQKGPCCGNGCRDCPY